MPVEFQHPVTAAFIRYLKQEVKDLARPIGYSCEPLPGRSDTAGRDVVRATLISVAAYLVRMSGEVTEPTLFFWTGVSNFLAAECGAAPASAEQNRLFFDKVIEANTPARLEKLALTDLHVLPALQKYDTQHETGFAVQMRMLIWRFAEAFVAADDEGTANEEAALDEFQKVLNGETAWSLLGFQPENLALFSEIKATIDDAKSAVEFTLREGAEAGKESPAGDVALFRSLQAVAVHLTWVLREISDQHVRFYRDFAWFFPKISNQLPTDNLTYWRAWLENISREPIAAFRDPFFLRVEYLSGYDLANGTNHADRCKAMFFRFANAFVKADGTLSDAEAAALAKLKELLYPTSVPVAAPAAEKPEQSEAATEKIGLQARDAHSTDELLDQLRSMVGLERVKAEVNQLVNFLKVQQLRTAKGLPSAQTSRHLMFGGNPGTGKTTVARLLASIYKSLGILSKGHLVETDRSGLVAGYLGQTAMKVQEIVKGALGGVLFIDEAYSLVERSDDSFGQEAVDTLLKLMEDNRNDLIVVVAGYTEKMNKFLLSNPGMKSRFNKYILFDDYTPDELVLIFESFCSNAGFELTPAARETLHTTVDELYKQRDDTFGNGRLARNLFEATINKQASRIVVEAEIGEKTLSTIEALDVPMLTEITSF